MGRTAGRKARALIDVQTQSDLVQAVARGFANRQMERSARAIIGGSAFDYSKDGSDDDSPAIQHAKVIRGEQLAALAGPHRKAVRAERRRLASALRRRGQPPKYPEVDAAILAAVSRGEPRDAVIRYAIAALRLTEPGLKYSRALHLQFLDRLKKNRRRLPD